MIGEYVQRQKAYQLEYKGFALKAFYRGIEQNADIEVWRDGKPFNFYRYPAYRIWNIYAHFDGAVDEHLRWEKEKEVAS